MAAQQWDAAMGRSDGREGGGAAMAMAAQRWLWQRSDGNGDGGAALGVAVVAAAVAVVHRPPLFAYGCSSATPDGRPPLFATDVRDVFCLHIFNVGIPYRRTDTGRMTV